MAALSPGQKIPTTPFLSLKKGEYGVLAFFKATCPTCMLGLPFIDKLFLHHRNDSNIKMFGIAQEPESEAEKFAQQFAPALPMELDSSPFKLSQAYQLTNVPAVFLVNSEGKIEQTIVGFIKKEYEALAQRLAFLTQKTVVDIFGGIQVPEMKPG